MDKIELKSLTKEQQELKDKLIQIENNLKDTLDAIDSIVNDDPESFYNSEATTDVVVSIFLNNMLDEVDKYISLEEPSLKNKEITKELSKEILINNKEP